MSSKFRALAAGVCLALPALAASAGELSYKSRGYGGPLYVGPNFEAGGQHETPLYGSKPGSQRPAAKRAPAVAKSHKAPEVDTETSSPAAAETSTGNDSSTASGASETTDTAAAPASAPCKKYDPTTGTTITVPCE